MTFVSNLGHVSANGAQEVIAERLGVPVWRSYHLLAADGIRPYKRGADYWYQARQLEAWLAARGHLGAESDHGATIRT